MSNSIAWDDPSVKVIVGVDTHKHEHVAVAINDLGARLATFRAPANRAGYADLVAWARTLGAVEAFGTEGTGSYGAGLASFVRREGLRVVEVNHCDRRKRRNNGKDDTLDAESAARSVLSGIATAIPKSADGTAESFPDSILRAGIASRRRRRLQQQLTHADHVPSVNRRVGRAVVVRQRPAGTGSASRRQAQRSPSRSTRSTVRPQRRHCHVIERCSHCIRLNSRRTSARRPRSIGR